MTVTHMTRVTQTKCVTHLTLWPIVSTVWYESTVGFWLTSPFNEHEQWLENGFRLMLGAFAGKIDSVKELCYRGADKQLADKGGSTAFHWAMDGGHAELVSWMLDNGADVTVTDSNGWTPLLRTGALIQQVYI